MSSSSSDSEEDARLKAAAVTVSDIFAEKKAKKAPPPQDIRNDHSRDSRYELDPECKKFLASKLDEMLEKTYKFTKRKADRAHEPPAKTESSGIRLFSNSEILSDVPEYESKQSKKRRKKTDIIPRVSATDEMLKSCAVSADWLLNENPLRRAQ